MEKEQGNVLFCRKRMDTKEQERQKILLGTSVVHSLWLLDPLLDVLGMVQGTKQCCAMARQSCWSWVNMPVK